jgi:hypothetical protein
VGLAAAMRLIADDRQTRSATREILAVMMDRAGEAFTPAEIEKCTLFDHETVACVLQALSMGRVLDFEPASGTYRYQTDKVLDLEVRRFIRHVDDNQRAVRTNVDRFRQRYGAY